jgi:hypothetical protein
MAFQDDRRRKPVFSYPTGPLKQDEKQSSEVTGFPSTCVDGPACTICNRDRFPEYQKNQLDQHVRRVKDAVDQYQDIVNSATKKLIETMKKHMDGNNHIMLLPGVVYAFALRNRRWCNCSLLESPESTVSC